MAAVIRKAYANHTGTGAVTIATAGSNGLQGNHLRVLNRSGAEVTITITILDGGSTPVIWDTQDVPADGGSYQFDGTLNLENGDVLQVTAAANCTTYFCAMEPV